MRITILLYDWRTNDLNFYSYFLFLWRKDVQKRVSENLILNNSQRLLKWCVNVKWKSLSHVWLFATPWIVHGNSPGQTTVVGSHSLLQGMFLTQGLNPGLLHCRRILYQLSHQVSPRILEWVAIPFSRGCSWPRDQTQVSHIAVRFFIIWATRGRPWASLASSYYLTSTVHVVLLV